MRPEVIDRPGDAGIGSVNLAIDCVNEKPGLPKALNRIQPYFDYLVKRQRHYGYTVMMNINITHINQDDVKELTEIAHDNGIDRFTAQTLGENRAMLAVFAKAGWPVHRRFESGVIDIDFSLDETAEFIDSVERREQRVTLRRDHVLDARRYLGVGLARDHALLLERLEPQRERPRADALQRALAEPPPELRASTRPY